MSKMEQLQSQLETATEEKDAAIKEAAEVGEKLVHSLYVGVVLLGGGVV